MKGFYDLFACLRSRDKEKWDNWDQKSFRENKKIKRI